MLLFLQHYPLSSGARPQTPKAIKKSNRPTMDTTNPHTGIAANLSREFTEEDLAFAQAEALIQIKHSLSDMIKDGITPIEALDALLVGARMFVLELEKMREQHRVGLQ